MLTNSFTKRLSLVFQKFSSQVLRGISTNCIFTQRLTEIGDVSSLLVLTFLQSRLGGFLARYHFDHI
jgi:hypothetical protein